jgi:hypothetical protein
MNYAGDDYVVGHILRFARQTRLDLLKIDFVTGQAGPPELLQEPVSEVPSRYLELFWDLVQCHGSDRALIRDASLTLMFDLTVERPLRVATHLRESPFSCDVQIVDVRGVEYSAHFDGWWHPERLDIPDAPVGLGFKIWRWLRKFVPHR